MLQYHNVSEQPRKVLSIPVMEAKRGKKRALEEAGDESQPDGEMVGKGKVLRGNQRGGEEEEMVEDLARAVMPTPPAKRVGKSRAASSGLLINATR